MVLAFNSTLSPLLYLDGHLSRILEAMISGLPTFGTMFGGPLEIIQDKINGFYINPTNYVETSAKLLEFIISLW